MTEGRSRGKQPSAGRQNKENWGEEKLREKKKKAGRVRKQVPKSVQMTSNVGNNLHNAKKKKKIKRVCGMREETR